MRGILQDTTGLRDHKLRTCRCIHTPRSFLKAVNHQREMDFGRPSFGLPPHRLISFSTKKYL